MKITDLESWLNASFSREGTGIYDDMKLKPLQLVLEKLPPAPAPITIAGTKGKGSTVAFIEAGLLAAGKTCLAFTSPHVSQLAERWRINGALASQQELCNAASAVADAEEESGEALTYFERCFAIAVHLASHLDLDYFLCEVGLGGRLDCANALDCQLAICCSISFDHCAVLGNTLREIATEKLAISRENAALILARQSTDAAAAISTIALRCSQILPVTQIDDAVVLGMLGEHQRDNASTALCALRHLVPDCDASVFTTAFADCRLAARCQIIEKDSQRFLIDAAHNAASMDACMQTAAQTLRPAFTIIIGSNIDKELSQLCDALPAGSHILRCGFHWSRVAGNSDWPDSAQDWPWYENINDALAAIPSEHDCCITGSFYLAGEALDALKSLNTLPTTP